MKKFTATLLLGLMTLSSVSFASDNPIKTIVPTTETSSEIERGGTGWEGGYGSIKKTDSIYVAGEKMPAKLEVFVRDGLFVLGDGELDWKLLIEDTSSNSDIYLNSFGCDIINTPSWEVTQGGHKYSTLVKIKGDGSLTETTTISFDAALELINTLGISISIPGIGEISSEKELKAAFGGSASKEVTITMSNAYTSYHDASFTVEGYEDIDFSVY